MPEFRIRRALLSEQKQLEDLQLRASLTNENDRAAILAHPDAIELPPEQIAAGSVFVSERNSIVAGFAAVCPRSDGEAELDALFVEPGLRRLGIGRSLVEHCVRVAQTQGSRALHVIGNPHAKDFYLACGFTIIGTTDTRFGIGLLLQKRFTAEVKAAES